jgi:hypothetical protein
MMSKPLSSPIVDEYTSDIACRKPSNVTEVVAALKCRCATTFSPRIGTFLLRRRPLHG